MRLKIERKKNSGGSFGADLRFLFADAALILTAILFLKEGKLFVNQALQVLMFIGLMWRVDEWLFGGK